MRYLSHVDEYLTLKYKYKYQVLHLWYTAVFNDPCAVWIRHWL